jgi:hypothetical protein
MSWRRWAGIQQAIKKAGGLAALGLTATQYLVLECLAEHESKEGRCDPCSETVARERGLADSTVREAWGGLTKLGFIDVKSKRRVQAPGKGYINCWGFNEERIMKVKEAQETQKKPSGLHKKIAQKKPSGLQEPVFKQGKKKTIKHRALSLSRSTEAQVGAEVGGAVSEKEEEGGPAGTDSLTLARSHKPGPGAGGQEPVTRTGSPVQPEVPGDGRDEIMHVPEEGPTLPCLVSFVAHLAELGIRNPSRKKPWPVYEAQLRIHSEDQLLDIQVATTWGFAQEEPDRWVTYYTQPGKDDLIGFYVKHTDEILAHYETHMAQRKLALKKRTKVEHPTAQIEATRTEHSGGQQAQGDEPEDTDTGWNPF